MTSWAPLISQRFKYRSMSESISWYAGPSVRALLNESLRWMVGMVPRCYGENDVPRLEGAGAWCGSAAELSRLIASIDGMPHVKDILSKKSVEYMTREQPDHHFSLGWNYTAKGKPWIRTGSLSGTSALVLKYPDGQCWTFNRQYFF